MQKTQDKVPILLNLFAKHTSSFRERIHIFLYDKGDLEGFQCHFITYTAIAGIQKAFLAKKLPHIQYFTQFNPHSIGRWRFSTCITSSLKI